MGRAKDDEISLSGNINSRTGNILLACFFMSGAAGLVYQVAWVRILSLVFGNTIYAVSIVVAGFMTGLALGSHVWGKWIDRIKVPLNTYIKLEIGIALASLAITLLIFLLDDVIVSLMSVDSISSGGWLIVRYILVFILLLAPTFLMGGTTPVMSKFYVNDFEKVGEGIGSIYAANTYGAMFGCFFTGFLLVPFIGVNATIAFAAFLNMLVAWILTLLGKNFAMDSGEKSGTINSAEKKSRKKEKKAVQEPAGVSVERYRGSVNTALALILISGFSMLAFEVLWTRGFIVSFKSTVYLFSNLLTVFLLGMAFGSHLSSRWIDRLEDPLKIFGLVQVGIGLFGILSVVFFSYSESLASSLGMMLGEITWVKDIMVMFILMLFTFFLPATLMGISYPVICRVATDSLSTIGRDVGLVYAVGTAGGIAGSLFAGFFLIPSFGLQYGIFIVSALSLVNGYAGLFNSKSRKTLGPVLPVTAVLAIMTVIGFKISGTDIGIGTRSDGRLIFSKEDVMGTVKVEEKWEKGPLTLMVNNYQLATSGDIAVRFGHIPLLFKPDSKDVLVISLGSGITSGSVGDHPVESIESVEIVPALLDIQPLFKEYNHNIVADRRFRLTFWDGRHYIKVTRKSYDLVISDLFQPDSAGVGNLYSLEHFRNVKEKLKSGGAMAQWLPLYQISPESLKVVMRTFAAVFEHVVVWSGDVNSELPTLMLLGSSEPILINPAKLHERMDTESVTMDMIENADPLSFLSFFVMDRDGVMKFTEGSPINSDNRPVIEYTEPRKIWNRKENAVFNFASLVSARQLSTKLLPGADEDAELSDAISNYFDARTKLLEGKVEHAKRNYNLEIEKYKEAAALAPIDPYLALSVFELGYLYYNRGDLKTSVKLFEWTKAINADLPEVHFYLAKAYQKLGMQEKSENSFKELARLRPQLAEKLVVK